MVCGKTNKSTEPVEAIMIFTTLNFYNAYCNLFPLFCNHPFLGRPFFHSPLSTNSCSAIQNNLNDTPNSVMSMCPYRYFKLEELEREDKE